MKLRMLVLASALGLALPAVSYADTVFFLNGTLTDGGTVHGTITMDLTAGQVTAANFTVVDGSSYLFNGQLFTGGTGNFPTSELVFTSTGFAGAEFVLDLPASTKVGYSGGSVCSDSFVCIDAPASPGVSSGLNDPSYFVKTAGGAHIDLGSGTMATPEPSSFMLMGTGMMGVASMLRRKLFARS